MEERKPFEEAEEKKEKEEEEWSPKGLVESGL